MTSITYIGMDVHTTNFTFCSYSLETDAPFAQVTLPPVPGSVVSYIQKLRKMHSSFMLRPPRPTLPDRS